MNTSEIRDQLKDPGWVEIGYTTEEMTAPLVIQIPDPLPSWPLLQGRR